MHFAVGLLVKHTHKQFDSIYIVLETCYGEISKVYDIKNCREYAFCNKNLIKLDNSTEVE